MRFIRTHFVLHLEHWYCCTDFLVKRVPGFMGSTSMRQSLQMGLFASVAGRAVTKENTACAEPAAVELVGAVGGKAGDPSIGPVVAAGGKVSPAACSAWSACSKSSSNSCSKGKSSGLNSAAWGATGTSSGAGGH